MFSDHLGLLKKALRTLIRGSEQCCPGSAGAGSQSAFTHGAMKTGPKLDGWSGSGLKAARSSLQARKPKMKGCALARPAEIQAVPTGAQTSSEKGSGEHPMPRGSVLQALLNLVSPGGCRWLPSGFPSKTGMHNKQQEAAPYFEMLAQKWVLQSPNPQGHRGNYL